MSIKKNVLKQQYWEYLIPALAVTSLLILYIIISSKKIFRNEEDQKWFETRIQANLIYKITPLETDKGTQGSLTMFLVERPK
jgi:hypothetical protein